jgi:hypothetical protein
VALQIGAAVLETVSLRLRMSAHTRSLIEMRRLAEALARNESDHHDACPRAMSVLVERGYLTRLVTDAWGTTLALTCTSPASPGGALIVSAGPDRTFGTPDDLRSDREPALLP